MLKFLKHHYNERILEQKKSFLQIVYTHRRTFSYMLQSRFG